jgi:hypothetical protein
MAKIPHSPDEIFSEFVSDNRAVYGEELIAIILYGSGVGNEYVYKKSDINFLVVLSEKGIEDLSRCFHLIRKWSKKRVAVPLFLTREYIASSLDSFPIEFLNMQRHYKVVYGEDVLAPLEIPRENLRLQCEEQLKGKLLHLRKAFLTTTGKRKALQNLLSVTVPTFVSLFTAILTLAGAEPSATKSEILRQTAEQFGLDGDVFRSVLAVREKSVKYTGDTLIALTQNYISEINKLTMIIDKWSS